jgi:hypothetical protein
MRILFPPQSNSPLDRNTLVKFYPSPGIPLEEFLDKTSAYAIGLEDMRIFYVLQFKRKGSVGDGKSFYKVGKTSNPRSRFQGYYNSFGPTTGSGACEGVYVRFISGTVRDYTDEKTDSKTRHVDVLENRVIESLKAIQAIVRPREWTLVKEDVLRKLIRLGLMGLPAPVVVIRSTRANRARLRNTRAFPSS